MQRMDTAVALVLEPPLSGAVCQTATRCDDCREEGVNYQVRHSGSVQHSSHYQRTDPDDRMPTRCVIILANLQGCAAKCPRPIPVGRQVKSTVFPRRHLSLRVL